jgi:hypothetical protein
VTVIHPRYRKEEFAHQGDEIYERDIRPRLARDNEDKFIVTDTEAGAYEMDRDEVAASDRLLARHPDAQVQLRRVGSRYAYHLGLCWRKGARK